ncbi:natural killer cells antigen CD94-like [Ornithorhynchus anatinus]|uniref:Natural killer cells antigen CD94 n=1 Tax=Ornithorhynchus anatinus TaxID=9258 RepID=A0A6I8PB99_ORNAN|nr:natural killer cells antigen CD94-like [Ornithorhynchus anatinus]
MSTSWRLLAGTLGALALALLASVLALGILMTNYSSGQGSESPFSVPNTTTQKGCYTGSCPENWIWNRGNCYYLSRENKNWSESQTACRSMNSSLLMIEDREELQDFLKLLKSYYWIGLSRTGSAGPWLWEDGSGLSHDLSVKDIFSNGWCANYQPGQDEFSSEDCLWSLLYICELRAM